MKVFYHRHDPCYCSCHKQPNPFRISRRERIFNWLLGRPVHGWAVESARYANDRDYWKAKCEGKD